MVKVPYSPVPDVTPSGGALPGMSGEAPAEAFGSGVANAVGNMGKQLERSSDELFQRAYAMQQLANESAAREADAEYMMKTGELHANFNSLVGRAAVDAFPQYQKDLKDLRDKIGSTMSNPMQKRMYDTATRGTMARTIFNGAGHAATQNRKWAGETIQATIDLDVKALGETPNDDVLFQEKLNRIRINTNELAALNGVEPNSPVDKLLHLEKSSQAWASRIIGVSRTDPIAAAEMLDKNKGNLTAADFLRVDTSVRNQSRAIGSANIADEVYTSDPSKSLSDMEAEARAKAARAFPEDPIFERATVAALHGRYNQNKRAENQYKLENREVVSGAIQSGARTVQELRADPKVAAAIDSLPKSEQNKIPGALNNYNRQANLVEAGDNDTRLRGLSSNDVEAYLNTDIMSEKLTKAQIDWHIERQKKLKDKAGSDPRVMRALGQLRGAIGSQLEALGIYSRTKDNMEEFDKFTGALQTALDAHQDYTKKPATYDDVVNVIGPQIIKERTVPGFFGMLLGGDQRPFFDQDVPADFAERLKADVIAKGGDQPTEQQIYRAYVRKQYFDLYGPKKDQSKVGP